MSDNFTLQAELRDEMGKGASRRLRRLADKVPAILYGGSEKPSTIMLEHRHLTKALENESFYSQIITLEIAGKKQQAVVKDLQRHPAKPRVLHADFLRVSADQKITVRVPLHFINEEICVGVKQEAGVVSHQMTEVEISCLPGVLPEYIEVDMIEATVGTMVHLSDLILPEGVEIVALTHGADYDQPIANVHTVKVRAEDDEGVAETPAGSESEADDGGSSE